MESKNKMISFITLIHLFFAAFSDAAVSPGKTISRNVAKSKKVNYVAVDEKHNEDIDAHNLLTIGSYTMWVPGHNFTNFHSEIYNKIPFAKSNPRTKPQIQIHNQDYIQIKEAKFHISEYVIISKEKTCDETCLIKPDSAIIHKMTSPLFKDIQTKRDLLAVSIRRYIPLSPNTTCMSQDYWIGKSTNQFRMRLVSLKLYGSSRNSDNDKDRSKYLMLELPLQIPGSCMDALVDIKYT